MEVAVNFTRLDYYAFMKKDVETRSGIKGVDWEGAQEVGTTPKQESALKNLEKDIALAAVARFQEVKLEMEEELLGIVDEGNSRAKQSINVRIVEIDLEIETKDEQISRKLELNLSQTFIRRSGLSLTDNHNEKIKLLDPLVVNFDGKGVELSEEKFAFDLDSDGRSDQISLLERGSGFLALDRDGNGTIDDGAELFGTKSGDGFLDLSIYDINEDNQIDINDDIYDKLRIWRKNDGGEDSLIALGESGVGVIYLDAKKSKEMLYDDTGKLAGVIQKNAAIEMLNGEKRIISHLDMVVA